MGSIEKGNEDIRTFAWGNKGRSDRVLETFNRRVLIKKEHIYLLL